MARKKEGVRVATLTAQNNTSIEHNIQKTKQKSRSWTWVVYEEQIEAVRQWLEGSPEIAWAMSPKHSDDLNPDGTLKKPHWHLCVSFMGPTTWNVAKGISDGMGLPIPQVCRNTRGMIRYFLHLDNPEKAQYLKTDITVGGGFNVDDYLKLTQSEKDAEELQFIQELEATIHEKGLFEFHQLVQYVLTEKPEMWQHFRKNQYVLKQYVYSLKLSREVWKKP